jgi:ABC transport system ATP-binding/permease protein
VCDRVLAFEGHGRVYECAGNYSYYQEKRAAAAAAEVAALNAPVKKVVKPNPTATKPKKFSQKDQRELAEVEATIAQLEQQIATLEQQSNDPAFYAQPGADTTGLFQQMEACRSQLETAMTRWAELEEIREASAG